MATYPIGYSRQGFPPMIGWAEVVRMAGRNDTSTRRLRDRFPDEFPEPVAVTSATPVFVTEEIRQFLDAHPRQRTTITDEMARSIQAMDESGTAHERIAAVLEIHINTVHRYANASRI